MPETMHLIVLKETGHVLAVASAGGGAEPTLETLCAADIAVGGVRDAASPGRPGPVLVAREQLKLESVTYDPAVAANCRQFIAENGHLTQIVPPGAVPAIALNPGSVGLPGLADKTFVAICGAADPAANRRIGVGETTPITLATSPTGDVPMPVPGGSQCMVLVATIGQPIRVTRDTA